MPLLLELVMWALILGLLALLAAGFTLAVFQALRESYRVAAGKAALLAIVLWAVVILWPLQELAESAGRLFGF